MIEIGLIGAVTKLIAEAVKDVRVFQPVNRTVRRLGSLNLDDKAESEPETELTHVPLKVFEGIFPPKDNEGDQFPYVMVGFDGGSANVLTGLSTVQIRITIGVFAPDSKGYHDAVNLMDRIINSFAEIPDNILGSKYNLDHTVPIQWEPAQDQPYPFFIAYMVTSWNHVSPRQTLKDVDKWDL